MQPLFAQTPAFNWASQASGSGSDYLTQLKYDASGNQYLLGSFMGSITLDEAHTLTSPNTTDFFIAKYDASGDLLWANRLSENSGADFTASDLHVDASGNITIAGYFSGQLDLGEDELNTSTEENIFYARYTASGELEWARQIGGPNGDEIAAGVNVDESGNIYLTGRLLGEVDVDGPEMKQDNTAFLIKLDPSGNLLWKQENTFPDYEGFGSEAQGLEVKIDPAGNVILAGVFSKIILWGGIALYTQEGQGLFIVKFNPKGEVLWAHEMRTDHERSLFYYDMEIDESSNIYFTGSFGLRFFYNNISYENVNYTHGNKGVAYVLKINPDGKGEWIIGTREASGDFEGAEYYAEIQSILVHESGRIFGVGNMWGDSISFGDIVVQPDPGLHNRFITEVSPEGEWLWVEKLAGDPNESMQAVLSTDLQGNLTWAGEFTSSIRLGESHFTSRGGTDLFLTSLDLTPEPAAMRVTSFTLVNADTEKDVMTLNNGEKLYLNGLPERYNIRANVTGEVGSVKLMLNSASRVENEAPYALAGDRDGNYHAMSAFTPGIYNLSAIPYSEDNRGGTAGEELSIQFEVVGERENAISFTLVDAKYETDIMEINHGDVLYLNGLTDRLNIRADVHEGSVGSVVLRLTGYPERIENEAPYALAGDRGGDYHDMRPTLGAGTYTLYAAVYSGANGGGSKLAEQQITFEARSSSTSMQAEGAEELTAYPNPFADHANLEVAVVKSGYHALGVYDTKGRLVQQLYAGQMEAGSRVFTFDATGLPNGVYVVKLVNEREIKHQKVVLSR
jgi:hypothetical protein